MWMVPQSVLPQHEGEDGRRGGGGGRAAGAGGTVGGGHDSRRDGQEQEVQREMIPDWRMDYS